MPLARLFRSKAKASAAIALYHAIVEAARHEQFYAEWGVPDSLDGRFEVLALNAFLVMRRLKADPETAAFTQDLFDLMFKDMDRNLREMGASDLGVGRQVKAMAKAFYGRVRAYERGLDGSEDLVEALKRNLYGTTSAAPAQLGAIADYMRRMSRALDAVPIPDLIAGKLPSPQRES